MKVAVHFVTKDILEEVEYGLALGESDGPRLTVEPVTQFWPVGSLFWVGAGGTAAEINAVLAAMEPHAQAIADGYAGIEALVPAEECASFPQAVG